MLIEIFGPNQEEVTKDGRKSHNEKLHNYHSRNIFPVKIRKDKMGRACGMYQREEKYILSIDQET